MAAYSVDGGPVEYVEGEDAVLRVPGLFDAGVLKVAHNAQFERVVLSEAARRAGLLAEGEFMDPREWDDTMALAAEWGLPLDLAGLAEWLGGAKKDSAGTLLINFFSKPNRRRERNLPESAPEKWEAFAAYCRQDVVALRGIWRAIPSWPTETEREVWLADQRINDRGVKVDVRLATAAEEAAGDNRLAQEVEMSMLTGLDNPGSTVQLLGWLRANGVDVLDVTKETVERALARDDLTTTQRRVLELRQELALVASKKFTSVLAGVSRDGRLRGQFRFYGAHTGRWSGRGVQLHNLPRLGFPDDATANAAIVDVLGGFGADAETLKRLVRPLLLGPFTVVDYSAIEARVLAWLAGEEWALEAFREGRDLYVETADRMTAEVAHGGRAFTRKDGKVAVLALGYNGGVNSLRAMGAEGADAELQVIVDLWRRANPSIVSFWRELGEAFMHGGTAGKVSVQTDGDVRHILLPSGRSLVYRGFAVRTEDSQFGPRRVATFRDVRRGGARVKTYGGRLAENVTQAVARDVLAEALLRIPQTVVGHVHDEILVEVVAKHSVQSVAAAMTEPISWARGLPLGAAGFTTDRYRKEY